MPYISQESKENVDKGLVALGLSEFECAGDLNYAIHQLIAKYIKFAKLCGVQLL